MTYNPNAMPQWQVDLLSAVPAMTEKMFIEELVCRCVDRDGDLDDASLAIKMLRSYRHPVQKAPASDGLREALGKRKKEYETQLEYASQDGNEAGQRYWGAKLDEVLFVLQALTQPAASEPSAEWKPINTAPKDGTHILLLVGGVAIGGCYEIHSEGWESGIPDWYGWDTDDDLIIIEDPNDVTHWMPLPAAPEQVIKESKDRG